MKVARPYRTALVVGLLLGVAGCGPSSHAHAPAAANRPTSSTVAAVGSTAPASGDLLRGRVLPMFAYEETPDAVFATSRAVAILKNTCLAKYGFPPLPVPKVPTESPPMYRVYGVTDPAIAARYGYHLDPIGLAEGADAQTSPTYSPSEQLVLLGFAPGHAVPNPNNPVPEPTQTYQGKVVPPFGCQGEATKAVKPLGVTGEELGLAQSLGADAWIRSVADPRVTALTAKFQQCMNTKGFPGHFEDPLGPVEAYAHEGRLTSKEITAAVTDVACKRQTKLIDTWFDVDSEYENAAIQNNLETLTKVKAAQDAAVATALKIAGNGG